MYRYVLHSNVSCTLPTKLIYIHRLSASQTAINSLYKIHRLTFLMDTHCISPEATDIFLYSVDQI